MDGTYLGSHRCDDLDEMGPCEECHGSGIDEVCDLCRELELIYNAQASPAPAAIK